MTLYFVTAGNGTIVPSTLSGVYSGVSCCLAGFFVFKGSNTSLKIRTIYPTVHVMTSGHTKYHHADGFCVHGKDILHDYFRNECT